MPHRVLFSEAAIAARIEELADEIAAVMPADLMAVGILNACVPFLADLVRALDRAGATPGVELMRLSSYANGRTPGEPQLIGPPPAAVAGREVLIVDTVLDTGRSLAVARRILAHEGATQLRACALVSKQPVATPTADFVGFSAPADAFLVGYGLDDAQRLRHLRYIAAAD